VLHWICRDDFPKRSFEAVVDAHTEAGQPIDMFDKKHRTPLNVTMSSPYHLGIKQCHACASPFEKDCDNETPFSFAIKHENGHVARAFCLVPGVEENGTQFMIDQVKLLSHLMDLDGHAARWLCWAVRWIESSRKFQDKPLILHVLRHSHVGFLVGLMKYEHWPLSVIEDFQKKNQDDIVSQPSWVKDTLQSMLAQMSTMDRFLCRQSIWRGGGPNFALDPRQ